MRLYSHKENFLFRLRCFLSLFCLNKFPNSCDACKNYVSAFRFMVAAVSICAPCPAYTQNDCRVGQYSGESRTMREEISTRRHHESGAPESGRVIKLTKIRFVENVATIFGRISVLLSHVRVCNSNSCRCKYIRK